MAIAVVLALLAYVYYHPIDSMAPVAAYLQSLVRFVERLGLWPKFKQLISESLNSLSTPINHAIHIGYHYGI